MVSEPVPASPMDIGPMLNKRPSSTITVAIESGCCAIFRFWMSSLRIREPPLSMVNATNPPLSVPALKVVAVTAEKFEIESEASPPPNIVRKPPTDQVELVSITTEPLARNSTLLLVSPLLVNRSSEPSMPRKSLLIQMDSSVIVIEPPARISEKPLTTLLIEDTESEPSMSSKSAISQELEFWIIIVLPGARDP